MQSQLQKAGVRTPYEMIPSCVGSYDGSIAFEDTEDSGAHIADGANGSGTSVPIMRIDTFCSERRIGNVSWIKADLEGTGLDMVRGAEEVIRRDRPLLTLAIYHGPQEFFEIPELLHQWIPEYKMLVRRCQCHPSQPYNEIILIAYVE